ncbi:MAG TPA: hypothetical protein VHV78_17400, partial [Gemmatimonadaceae bacterium]|nr:hypothetical protein [Gemmatimonadaceae bacterium]
MLARPISQSIRQRISQGISQAISQAISRRGALALALSVVTAHASAAQSASGLLSDGTVLPSRAIRFGAYTSFTRWDDYFGNGLTQNEAAGLANNAVGPTQLPFLAPTQSDIRAASGLSSFQLNIGQLTAAANSRIFTMPLIFEYGLTSRLTIGVSVPIVETRTTLVATLNPQLGMADVGLNPALAGSGARNQNALLISALRSAADTLQGRVSLCQSAPSNPICSSINGQQSAAQSLVQSTSAFASALEKLYGGVDPAATRGDQFVPIASDPTAIAIARQIISLNSQYRSFLNQSLISGSVANAQAPAARDALQSLVTGFGHDSIQVADRDGIGDISIAATYQLANS